MSLIALAEAIDHLVDNDQAFVDESATAITVSNLSAAHAKNLKALCVDLAWANQLFDSANEHWDDVDLDLNFQPFRLVITKPRSAEDTIQLLTNRSFYQWLLEGHAASKWQVARLKCNVLTGTRVFSPWGENNDVQIAAKTKSPRTLVKEFSCDRKVPDDVRPWLAVEMLPEHFDQPATQVWIRAASNALIHCLPDEIDVENFELKFRGPPHLVLPKFDGEIDPLDFDTFSTLLAAVTWVFENEREAEMRHILLASDLSRSGSSADRTSIFLKENLVHALQSAKVAYQMAVAETGRDTLKILSDLRKAVTEETAKLSDMGRQLTGAVAAAVATGIGLIATRVATNAPALLICMVMGVVALYVTTVIFSGWQFMSLQKQLRGDWQHRLYRFLPPNDYQKMVETPTRKAERAFECTAFLGGSTVLLLMVVCIWLTLITKGDEPPSSHLDTSKSVVIKPLEKTKDEEVSKPIKNELSSVKPQTSLNLISPIDASSTLESEVTKPNNKVR